MNENIIKIYSDWSCIGNPWPWWYASILVFGESNKIISWWEAETTNNRMELTAVITGLSSLKSDKYNIQMYVDSKYVYDGITQYIDNWQKNWRKSATKQPVKNQDLWLQLVEVSSKFKISWNHVMAHKDDILNNLVDKIARKEANKFIEK